MDTSRRRSRIPTTGSGRDMEKVQTNEEARVLFMILICSSQCNYSMKRQQISRLMCCSKHGYSFEVKNGELEHNYKYSGLVPHDVPGLSSYSNSVLSSTSRTTDQQNSFRKLGTFSVPVTIRNDKAYMRETEADRSSQTCLGKPWFSTQTRRDERGRSNARHSRLVSTLHRKSRNPGDACVRISF